MVGDVIKMLVLQGKRVIIPNFGAFLIKDSSQSSMLLNDNVTFSPFLRYNDGVLENEVSHNENLHKDEASKQVSDFVDAIKVCIFEEGKVFEIEGLGCFFVDGKGNVCFSTSIVKQKEDDKEIVKSERNNDNPSSISSDTSDNLKINSIFDLASDSIVDSTTEQVFIKQPSDIDEEKEITVKVEVDTKQMVDNDRINDNSSSEIINIASKNNIPPSKKFSKGILIGFLLILFSLLALNLFWNDIFGIKTEGNRPKIVLDPIEEKKMDEIAKVVEKKHEVQDAIDEHISSSLKENPKEIKPSFKPQEKAKYSSNQQVEQKKSSKIQNEYVIVLGSFGTHENAQKCILELSRKSIKAKVIVRNKMNSVVFGSFENYEDAQKEQNRLKSMGVDGWISRK